MEVVNQDQLSGYQIHLRKKSTGKWIAFIPSVPDVTGQGNTLVESLQNFTFNLSQILQTK